MKVIAALSGGVDSAVAAARLVDAGHEVVGVHLALARSTPTGGRERGCCTLDDARDARRVADSLDIAFYLWDLSERFRDEVIADFVAEYAVGRTPNPCMRCNERIKFAAVLDRALGLGFDAVATGHYAQVLDGPCGPQLHRAVDPDKDQSYVLGMLTAQQLAHAVFPLGADHKQDVRREAQARGFAVARKADSVDLCFVPDGDTRAFLAQRLQPAAGPVVDVATGAAVGRHDGAPGFTIGQRRGLALSVPSQDGAPRFVVGVEPATATVFVGSAGLLEVDVIEGDAPTWAGPTLGGEPVRVTAQVRAHGAPIPARAAVRDGRLVVDLDEPVRGLAAGQAVVLYDGTRVIGSATVDRTDRRRSA